MKRVLIALLLSAALLAARGPGRPNILFIFADDIGYEAFGCYGGLDFETPRIDAMAADGLRFTRAYMNPLCVPSRVSLHTGRHTTTHGFTKNVEVHLGSREAVDFTAMPTFAQKLRAAGYRTAVSGKWQLAGLEFHPDHPRTAGFDRWCLWQIWKDGAKTTRYWNPCFNENGTAREDIAERFGPDVLVEFVIAEMTAARDEDEPFLIVHNELLPHWPIVATPDDRAAGREGSLAGMVAYLDQLVGRLLDAVTELGLRESTYVLFMGDNGTPPQLLNPRRTEAGPVRGGKRDLNDAGTHVPLIAWGPPSLPPGGVCEQLIDIVDLFPTFCGLAGIARAGNRAPGTRSMLPALRGEPLPARPWTRQGVFERESVFDGKWRLRDDGQLLDARELPAESEADPADPAAREARMRLHEVFGNPDAATR